MSTQDEKRAAAHYAAGLVEPGMALGLGSGSTAEIAIALIGERVRQGLQIVGVPTSDRTAQLAQSYGIPLTTLEEYPQLDLALDGADEVDPHLNLIKGHGGALLREKIVALAARRFVVIVDSSKRVQRLGERFSVPIEVIPFGWSTTQRRIEMLGLPCELRRNGQPYRTDSDNFILHCPIPPDVNLTDGAVADAIKQQTGVVEHGLFLGIATEAVVGTPGGGVEILRRQP